jgi:hypothetical protein
VRDPLHRAARPRHGAELRRARAYPDSGTGASGHYYIERDGAISRFVDPVRSANHTRGYNPRSIGIELINLGRYPDWYDSRRQAMTDPYPEVQIESLLALIAVLRADFPALAPRRRARRPGPGPGAGQRRRQRRGAPQARSRTDVPLAGRARARSGLARFRPA